MAEFFEDLISFLFTPGASALETKSLGYLIFATASGFMGLVVVLLDFIAYKLLGKSFLKLGYYGWRCVLVFLFWGLGAGMGGFLGAVVVIFQLSLQASASVGIGWPLILPRLIDAAQMAEETQSATEESSS